MKRLLVNSTLSISNVELGEVLDYKDKTLYTFTKHSNEFKDLVKIDDINKHTSVHTADHYYLISGKGTITVDKNYDEFCRNVQNLVPVSGEIYVKNKNNSMNNGTDYINNSLTYDDDTLLQYLSQIDKKNKFSRWKEYAIVVGIIKGTDSSEIFSDSADIKLTLNNTLLRLSKNMSIVDKKIKSCVGTYDGSIMTCQGIQGSQTVGYEIKMFTFGIFSSKPRFI
jgi:hypothetical protein